MLDDRFEDLLRDLAREYHDPPETPREAMWERIVEAQRERGKEGTREEPDETKPLGSRVLPFHRSRVPLFRHLRWAAGIAAVLALGVALGRHSIQSTHEVAPQASVASDTRRVSAAAYHLATTEHLSQSEAFLTLFRASLRSGGNERLATATARQLLATNRLLLDSPAATDPRTRLLLQDLELVLAEIAQLSPLPRSRDLDLITEGLERGGMMSRLRTAVPSGPSTTQGAL